MKIHCLNKMLSSVFLILFSTFLYAAAVGIGGACLISPDSSGKKCTPLLAGQTIPAGTVCTSVEGNNLIITYQTSNGWELTEVHAWVGDSLTSMPQTRKGSPIPGQFPYKSGDITGATSYSITVPLASLNFSCPAADKNYLIAAHAALRKSNGTGGYETQTGWGSGTPILDKGNWATYFDFTLSCNCGGGEAELQCDTAFAYNSSSQCFLNLGFNRWGWTTNISTLPQTFDLYAGAAQCDLSKGTLVGSVVVSLESGAVTVKYVTNPPYTMTETHVYVGDTLTPLLDGDPSVAPGQYGNIHNLNPAAANDLYNGILYKPNFIGHATVCKPAN